MQKVVTDNPKGVVHVVGNDSFCIAAFNGLRTAGFEGQVVAIPQCFSDATRTAGSNGHHGLGLSIVRAIATAHDGTVAALARPEGGLVVVVRLPAG